MIGRSESRETTPAPKPKPSPIAMIEQIASSNITARAANRPMMNAIATLPVA